MNNQFKVPGKRGALFLLCALAPLTHAADVRISGYYDTSLQVVDAKGLGGTRLEMAPDQVNATGFQIHANEALTPEYGVAVKLISVASADAGTLASPDGALFNHAVVTMNSPYGSLGFGRTGAFGSGFGPIGEWWRADPFISAYGDAGSQATAPGVYGEVLKNSLFYQTPRMNGLRLAALYSLTGEANEEGRDNSDNTTFWELFGDFETPTLLLMANVQCFAYGNEDAHRHMDNLYRFKIAFAKTFPNWSLYGGWSYGRNELKYNTTAYGNRIDFTYEAGVLKDGHNGRALDMHSFYVGAKKTIGSFDLMGMIQAQFGQNKGQASHDIDDDFVHYVFSVGGNYHLSKSTMLYWALTSSQVERGWEETQARELERRSAILGVTTAF